MCESRLTFTRIEEQTERMLFLTVEKNNRKFLAFLSPSSFTGGDDAVVVGPDYDDCGTRR